MSDWIDVRAAWARLEAEVRVLPTETVPLAAALGRVLRAPIAVDRDAPAFDRAAMDGYALHAAEVGGASRAAPVRLDVVGESTPGAPYGTVVPPGCAARIMTGAPLPDGCDAVLPVEDSSGFGVAQVEVFAPVAPGQHFTPRGRERRTGDALFAPGRRLQAADIGALAIVGAATVEVGRAPHVAILSTGNELVPHGEVPGAHHIRDSNGPMLAALAAPLAATCVALGSAPDDATALGAAVRAGLACDALLITGGVSMGAYDFVSAALEANGVRLHFRRVALQPGKPTGFGTHAGGIVVALPGNPVSALTTFRLFAAPALRLQAGESDILPVWPRAAARFAWERQHSKWLLLPGRRVAVPDGFEVERVPYAGSGDLLAYAHADCQIVLPPEIERVRPGDRVPVWAL